MKTMTCEECSLLLVVQGRQLFGDLEEYARATAENAEHAGEVHALHCHLKACSACARELAGLQALWLLLDREEQPDPQLKARVLSAAAPGLAVLAAQPGLTGAVQVQPGFTGWFARLWPARPVWASCYSLLLLSSGLVTGQLLPPGSLGLAPPASFDAAAMNDERLLQICPIRDPRIGETL